VRELRLFVQPLEITPRDEGDRIARQREPKRARWRIDRADQRDGGEVIWVTASIAGEG
jgi:hypothetical protein